MIRFIILAIYVSLFIACCNEKSRKKYKTIPFYANRSCGIKPLLDSVQYFETKDSANLNDEFMRALMRMAVLTDNIYFPSSNYFIYKTSTSQYAVASIDISGNAPMVIAYDPDRMKHLKELTKTQWVYHAVAAHEYTHHFLNHFYRSIVMDPTSRELAADTAIGYFLNKMGAPSLDSAQALMSVIAEDVSVNGYPTKDQRNEAIKAGWEKANLHIFQSKILSITSLQDSPRNEELAFAMEDFREGRFESSAIKRIPKGDSILIVDIPRMKSSAFYIDSKQLFYISGGNGLTYTLGTVCESSLPQFELMVYDEFYQVLYIDKAHVLFDSHGKKLGQVQIK